MERRKDSRIKINTLSIVVSDGIAPSRGMISDLSLSGMRINNLPRRLNINTSQLSVILSENKKLFRMNVNPRWYFEQDGEISMGVKIANTPLRWVDFILKHEASGCNVV